MAKHNWTTIKEYTDIAAQTAALGPLGAVSRLSERGEARSTLQQNEQRRQQTLTRIDSERQRIDEIVLAAQSEAEIVKAKEEAKKFAVETTFYDSPFGIHNCWKWLNKENVSALFNKYSEISELQKLQYNDV